MMTVKAGELQQFQIQTSRRGRFMPVSIDLHQ
jgi:hypothetical protein